MISIAQRKPSHAATKSTLFAVSKDESNTKENTGKSMKNMLYVLQYVPKGTSRVEAMSNSEKSSIIELRLKASVRQSVEK